ncbi:MAG: hypothetical protein SGARI_003369 [Bacillariaceae sp.]
MEVYHVKAVERTDEFEFQIAPSNTIKQVMAFIHAKWIKQTIRPRTAEYFRWKWHGPVLKYPDRENYDTDDDYQDAEAAYFRADDERRVGMDKERAIEDIPSFATPGDFLHLHVDYSAVKCATSFKLVFVAEQDIDAVSDSTLFPRLYPVDPYETVIPFALPEASPDIDTVFPLANCAMFGKKCSWCCPFPYSPTSAGFAEGYFHYLASNKL